MILDYIFKKNPMRFFNYNATFFIINSVNAMEDTFKNNTTLKHKDMSQFNWTLYDPYYFMSNYKITNLEYTKADNQSKFMSKITDSIYKIIEDEEINNEKTTNIYNCNTNSIINESSTNSDSIETKKSDKIKISNKTKIEDFEGKYENDEFDEFYKSNKSIFKKGNVWICEKCNIKNFKYRTICPKCNSIKQ